MTHKNDGTITPAVIAALLGGDFENAMIAATPGGIERQEKAGQTEFVNRSTLPKNCPSVDLQKLGFQFHDDVDKIFVNVTMPTGWYKQADNHSMWSGLYDDKGRRRASIFYKAAFYDRSAHMSLVCRYSVGLFSGEPPAREDYDSNVRYFVALDNATNEIIFKTESFDFSLGCAERDEFSKLVETWLDTNFPFWHDATAHWD